MLGLFDSTIAENEMLIKDCKYPNGKDVWVSNMSGQFS